MKNKETIIQFVHALIRISKTKDIDQIRVKELCQTAYISRSTFYQYFSDINELIERLEYYLINEFHQATDSKTEHAAWIHSWFSYFDQYKDALNTLLGPHGHQQFYVQIKEQLILALNQQMNFDGFPDDTLRKYFQSIYAETFLILAMEWTQKKYQDDLSIASLCEIALALREKKE